MPLSLLEKSKEAEGLRPLVRRSNLHRDHPPPNGKRDLPEKHVDPLLRPHFSRYQKTLVIDERPSHVVGIGKLSKDVARKLWVVL